MKTPFISAEELQKLLMHFQRHFIFMMKWVFVKKLAP